MQTNSAAAAVEWRGWLLAAGCCRRFTPEDLSLEPPCRAIGVWIKAQQSNEYGVKTPISCSICASPPPPTLPLLPMSMENRIYKRKVMDFRLFFFLNEQASAKHQQVASQIEELFFLMKCWFVPFLKFLRIISGKKLSCRRSFLSYYLRDCVYLMWFHSLCFLKSSELQADFIVLLIYLLSTVCSFPRFPMKINTPQPGGLNHATIFYVVSY